MLSLALTALPIPATAQMNKEKDSEKLTKTRQAILQVEEEMQVNVYGNTAVLTGLQFAKTQSDKGKEETSVVMFTDVFVKQKGKWALSLAHAMDLPQISEKYLQKK